MTNIFKSLRTKYDSNLGLYLGEKKMLNYLTLEKFQKKNMGLFSGRLRISGSSNFRDWFHFDASRPAKKKAIVLETDFKIYKRLWVTPEKHDRVFSILKKLV